MIRVDLSRALSPRVGTYLLAVIPGVFFESSIAIGNPTVALSVLSRLHEIYPFGHYALLVLFLVSSLFIGSGFFLSAWLAQQLMSFGFSMWRYAIRATFGSQWLYLRFGKLQGFPPKQTIPIRLLSRLIFWARGREFATEARPVLKCLRTATKRLLRERYGMEETWDLDANEWWVWYSVLGKPLKWFQEAILGSRTFLGCGLAGFTALYAAPALRERYFIALCSVFALSGLLVSFDLAFWNFSPLRRSLIRLKSVVLELSEITTFTKKQRAEAESGIVARAEPDHDDQG